MPGNPSYVYHPETEQTTDGFAGDGVVIMGVDILPTELPLESSRAFCQQLKPLLPDMVTANYHPKESIEKFTWEHFTEEHKKLSDVIKNAIILYRGKLLIQVKLNCYKFNNLFVQIRNKSIKIIDNNRKKYVTCVFLKLD